MGFFEWLRKCSERFPPFTEPRGRNFKSESWELPLGMFSRCLVIVLEFLQKLELEKTFYVYADWLEHDGMFFSEKKMTFSELLETVRAPESLVLSGYDDFFVHVGIAPLNTSWYLRYYIDEDIVRLAKKKGAEAPESLQKLVPDYTNKFDITLVPEFADRFRDEVVPELPCQMIEQDARKYFKACEGKG